MSITSSSSRDKIHTDVHAGSQTLSIFGHMSKYLLIFFIACYVYLYFSLVLHLKHLHQQCPTLSFSFRVKLTKTSSQLRSLPRGNFLMRDHRCLRDWIECSRCIGSFVWSIIRTVPSSGSYFRRECTSSSIQAGSCPQRYSSSL